MIEKSLELPIPNFFTSQILSLSLLKDVHPLSARPSYVEKSA